MKNKKIFTCGHSNKPLVVFIDILKKHSIEVLVDVRTLPVSRYCPHFNQNALQSTLKEADIKYLYRGKNLGGRGVNTAYEETIDELSGMAKKGLRISVMCSEKSFKECHRYSVLTPSFEERGIDVIHIEYEN